MRDHHHPLVFDSPVDRMVRIFCRRTKHFGAKQRRRMKGEITCERCYQVIGHWR